MQSTREAEHLKPVKDVCIVKAYTWAQLYLVARSSTSLPYLKEIFTLIYTENTHSQYSKQEFIIIQKD